MQNYKEINGNDYVKDSRTTINETMQSIQSMNSGTVFPTTNLFEGMKCYRTDLKKTYTLTDVENNTWVEDAHAALADEATHAASATKLQTPRALNLSGAVTADAASFDGTADATINVKTLDASKLKGTAAVGTTGNAATATKLATARTIALSGNATGSTTFDGSGNATINVTVNESAHAATATQVVATAPGDGLDVIHAIMGDNDAARVRVYGDTNNGALEIATGDDGTEPIYARQYKNSSIDKFTTVARTAAILDTNGNTSFPGTVTAPAFSGALSGNAATASKLASPRTISLTGNASGSANFDGSGNISINTTVNNAAQASKLAGESGNNYLEINTTTDNWNVLGSNPGVWLKSIRTNFSAPPYSIGNFSAAVAFGGGDTKGIITHAFDGPLVKFAGGNGSTAQWKFSIYGGRNNETYDLNNFPTKTGGGASGTWGINVTGNAKTATTATTATNATHASSADSATNADKVDGYHENSFLRYRGAAAATGEDTLWSQIGIKEYDNVLPESLTGTYAYGAVVSFPSQNDRLDLWYDCYASNTGTGLYYRTGWRNDKRAWARLLDSNNYTNWAPTKTGSGASGTWDISITGNAASATNATNAGNADTVDGIHADSMFYNKGDWGADNWGTIGAYQVNNNSPVSNAYGWGQVISSSTKNARFQLYASDQYGGNGRLHYRTGWDNSKHDWNTILDSENYNLFAPTKTGGGASGTWGINISGNAASATNADKLDGYHASDIINRISAANTGGIVAASLTENGYVKFANGLILQWGSNTGGGSWYHHTFPIAFSTVFDVIDGYSSTSTGQFYGYSKNITNTGFDMRIDSSETGRYIAIGI